MLPGSFIFAVDGDRALYEAARGFTTEGKPAPFSVDAHGLKLAAETMGSVAVVASTPGRWLLATDALGTYPLYYSKLGGGLLFSSLLRPLARALSRVVTLEPDLTAILEMLQADYALSGRSHFRDIRQLMPGQVLAYEPVSGSFALSETSDLWTGFATGNTERIAAAYWERLQQAATRCFDDHSDTGLMFSAGWDSRTILGAMQAHPGYDRVVCYTHGDPRCRELAIVGRMCRELGLRHVTRPLAAEAFALDHLERAFARTESLDGQWAQASQTLADMGVGCITCGLYGEIIGGHHGFIRLLRGYKQLTATAAELAPRLGAPSRQVADMGLLASLLSKRYHRKPLCVRRELWAEHPSMLDEMLAEVRTDLARLAERGVRGNDALAEAFMTEHRHSQYAASQIRSCRANVDIAMLFADHECMRIATAVPLHTKFVNRVDRAMLKAYAPQLARYPTAATLVPAGWPTISQEASRLVRRTYERGRWRLHSATRGSVPAPHFGWWDFEFLRDGKLFHTILDDLRLDIWDKQAVARRIDANSRNVATMNWRSESSLLIQDMLRMASVDMMLR
jgi:asparagine synthetase B (glutamine-hydrolysing)